MSARGSLGAHASRRPVTVLERRQGFEQVGGYLQQGQVGLGEGGSFYYGS